MQRVFKFIGVGIAATIVDYLVYSFVVMIIFGGNTDFVGVGAVSSGIVATFVAFIMHSKITWKNRNPGKSGIIKFFAWNALTVIAIRPVLTFVFGLLGGLYGLVFAIFDGVGIGFSYEFVESTGIYVLMTVVTMSLNYFFYDKIVFGTKNADEKKLSGEKRKRVKSSTGLNEEQRKEINVKRVRQAGEEKQSQGKTDKRGNK